MTDPDFDRIAGTWDELSQAEKRSWVASVNPDKIVQILDAMSVIINAAIAKNDRNS